MRPATDLSNRVGSGSVRAWRGTMEKPWRSASRSAPYITLSHSSLLTGSIAWRTNRIWFAFAASSWLTRYPMAWAACSTRLRVASPTPGLPDSARDTENFDKPTLSATSWMVRRRDDMMLHSPWLDVAFISHLLRLGRYCVQAANRLR